jgi:hypothetical protein
MSHSGAKDDNNVEQNIAPTANGIEGVYTRIEDGNLDEDVSTTMLYLIDFRRGDHTNLSHLRTPQRQPDEHENRHSL